uniref:Palmitoyltransferase n=2 Tax=Timema TaxID=61471 RepID=A0A7R9P8G6_TIMCA|nr:unnamed protein product [Timema californicum]
MTTFSSCPYLAEHITPAIPVIGGFLFIFVMSALLRTSFSDPGVIPRATQDEATYTEKQIGHLTNFLNNKSSNPLWLSSSLRQGCGIGVVVLELEGIMGGVLSQKVPNSANSPTYRPPPRTKEILVRGQPIKLKYCFTCKIFRPPRASHCSLCDNCVVTKDEKKPFLDAIKDSPASVIVGVVCFFSVWSVLGLAGFHTYLTTSNQTTNEDIKGSFSSKRGQESFNPYTHGNVCSNCFYVLCGPTPPSFIDRRGIVTPEFAAEQACSSDDKDHVVTNNKTYGTVRTLQTLGRCLPHLLTFLFSVSTLSPPLPAVTIMSDALLLKFKHHLKLLVYLPDFDIPMAQYSIRCVIHFIPPFSLLLPHPSIHPKEKLPFLSLVDDGETPKCASPFILKRVINDAAKSEVSIRKLRDGTVMIQTINDVQTVNVMGITEIPLSNSPHLQVKVEPRRFLNVCKRVVTCYDLDCIGIEELCGSNSSSMNQLVNGATITVSTPVLNDIDAMLNVDAARCENCSNMAEIDLTDVICDANTVVPLSASRLRLLQDTTMIESALDLDSLEESSVGTGSQAGLIKLNLV